MKIMTYFSGVTTEYLDSRARQMIFDFGAYPSILNFEGFPKSISTSVNNAAVHGVPDDRPLQRGDLINIDLSAYHQGFHGDTSKSFVVKDPEAILDQGYEHLI